jgi:hypothetical protein
MTTTELDSVHKLKRPFLWLVLVLVVAGFATWSERRLDDNRAQEIRVSQGASAQKRIAGTQPPTSAALLLQLRIASAMLEPSKPQSRRGFSPFGEDPSDPAHRADSQEEQGYGMSRTNTFGGQRNSSTNPFSSQTSTSPYVTSPNTGSGPSSAFGQNSTYGQPLSYGQSYGQSSTFGQSSNSRTNTRNPNDANSGLLGPDSPN